jgi:hypothetical protein
MQYKKLKFVDLSTIKKCMYCEMKKVSLWMGTHFKHKEKKKKSYVYIGMADV